MNCANCGARLVISPRGDYLQCEFCGGASIPKETRDGVRPLGQVTDKDCPVCKRPLTTAVIERVPTAHCGTCEGILVERRHFVDLVQIRRALYDGPRIPGRALDPEEGRRQVRCPACEEMMETHPYHGPGHVWIDSCGDCNLVWLDRGELTLIERS
jgi:Zn-finger nucleic acid-binding protein/DNA-directed RNA polymerase subunit RPC12/RpoP